MLFFVLVGATVHIRYALNAGVISIILIIGVLLFRMMGVFISLIKTNLNRKARIFIAYMPKATVQAAIGGLPLAMGLDCGHIALTVAVLSIIVTASIGAMLVDVSYNELLSREEKVYTHLNKNIIS